MAAEFADWLLRSGLALAAGIALVLALRPLWRRWLGSSSVLWLWLLLPAVLVATSLPRPKVVQEYTAQPAAVAARVDLRQPTAADGLHAFVVRDVTAPADAPSAIGWVRVFVVAWWLGAMLMLARLIDQQRHFLRRLGPLQRRADGSYLASSTRIGPAVVGALRPRIVLPADFEQRYDERQRALVLAHERCHLRRGDLQVNLLASALRCVFWFNPLVHLAAARLRVDQELACDAAVLRDHPDAGRAYATALLNTQLADLGLPVGCYWQSSQSLKWRIAMLKRPSPGTARLLAGATLALLASSATAATLWQLQPVTTVAVPAASTPARPDLPLPALQPVAITSAPVGWPAAGVLVAEASADAMAEAPAPPTTSAAPPLAIAAPATQPAPEAAPDYVEPRVLEIYLADLPRRNHRREDVTQGRVVAQVELDASGNPSGAVIAHSDLGPTYQRRALGAVQRWKFAPARRDGVAVPSTVLVNVPFDLGPVEATFSRALNDTRVTVQSVGMPVPEVPRGQMQVAR
jgi:TonB family protein